MNGDFILTRIGAAVTCVERERKATLAPEEAHHWWLQGANLASVANG
jgi:hypothetical protein